MKTLLKMRIIIGALCASMCLLVFSCGGGDASGEDTDTVTYDALSDTLSDIIGRLTGYRSLYEAEQRNDTAFDVDEYCRGLAVVLERRHPMAFVSGTTVGITMANDVEQIEENGITIDRERILEVVENTVNPLDSVAHLEQRAMHDAYRGMVNRLKGESAAAFTSEVLDSLHSAYARFIAKTINADLFNYSQVEEKEYDLRQFLAGVRSSFGLKNKDEFNRGVYDASNIFQQILVTESKGVRIRPAAVLDAMRETMRKGTVDGVEVQKLSTQLTDILNRVDRENYEKEDAEMASADRAVQNVRTGQALVTKVKNSNPDIKTTESGLSYIIYEEGEGEKIKDGDFVAMNYVGAHLDEKPFDSKETVLLAYDNLVPGLREGLKMLGKGGKARFWLPGELAFRGHGIPEAGVGPMETVIFYVEILDINPTE